jgi:hypothetical protein
MKRLPLQEIPLAFVFDCERDEHHFLVSHLCPQVILDKPVNL